MANNSNRKIKQKIYGNITRRSIVMDTKGVLKPSAYNQIRWATNLDPITISMKIKDLYMEKTRAGEKGAGKTVRIGEVLNRLYRDQLDNFFFNMGISVDAFLMQVNAQLPETDRIDRGYIEDVTHWTGQSKNKYNKYVGDLILPGGRLVKFNWDYDFGSSWSII